MNGLNRVAITLALVTGIPFGVWTAPALGAVSSGRPPGTPDVLHCC